MKECKIQLKDGEKEAELNITYKEENEMVIIDGVFKFFGIDLDFEDLAKKQLAIAKMYSDYYGNEKDCRTSSGSAEFAETGEPDFTLKKKEIIERPSVKIGPNPGIRIKNESPRYRCNYQCTKCNHAGNHYVPKNSKIVSCHECGNKMSIKMAQPDFSHDENYNYFLAGLRVKKES